MNGEEVEKSKKKERETSVKMMDKVGRFIECLNEAKHVDQVIVSLHSIALLLFPLDSSAISGSIDKCYRDEVLSAQVPSEDERQNWWQVFYGGPSFPTLSRLLLYDVASNWLACFPTSARKHVYDVFFVSGRITEVVQTLVTALQHNGNDKSGNPPICSNAERLVTLCLLENEGVLKMAREFGGYCQLEGIQDEQWKRDISRLAQLVTSIPDKARLRAPRSLSSHLFFKQVIVQLLSGAEEDWNLFNGAAAFHKNEMAGSIVFVGETFSRICRRGSADVLSNVLAPWILKYVRSFLLPKTDLIVGEKFESMHGSSFWSKMIEAIKDPYAVERMSEQLLHCLATHDISDAEAYWILWILFHRSHDTSIRSIFVEKFLFWKVFPLRCLRWILQFAVLECPPDATSLTKGHSKCGLLGTVEQLLAIWSKQEFVQSATIEQQTYVTAAVGLSLEHLTKEDLDSTKGAMHSVLQGVSCRLESPSYLVRKMASSVALVFSKVIDPKNPLYLDGLCPEEPIDWEFGIMTSEKNTPATSGGMRTDINQVAGCSTTLVPEKELKTTSSVEMGKNSLKHGKEKSSEFNLVDPDEVIDPAMLNKELNSDDEDYDDDVTENSETSSNSSLQPYDLTDDDTDLKRNFSQLVDVVGALRKSDDADGIERALNVAENLIRASPDELKFVAGDLSRTLVLVRCFDSAIEGEEESAEEKRQRALVALIVSSPLECLDTLNKLLYSSTLDVSQRIMILDVMTEAAQELAHARTTKLKAPLRAQISTVSETQPWFMPSSIGPPGVGPWREISGTGTPLNWSYSYERTLPSTSDQIKKGKSRRWGHQTERKHEHQLESPHNKFPQYAAAFMLPAMQGFDKKRHGVDLLGRDFLVLGKLVHMLGVCMKCAAMHPEASALALPLLDMLSSRDLCHHAEAYVRKSVLFAASCVLVALHPSYVASSLVEGNPEISQGLDWVRTWALSVAESDTDRECYTMAITCLHLHSEMALQASRAMESVEITSKAHSIGLPSNVVKEIKILHSNVKLF